MSVEVEETKQRTIPDVDIPHCELCKADLSVQPVLKIVRETSPKHEGRVAYQRRVRTKPLQVALVLRFEGQWSDAEQVPNFLASEQPLFRVCRDCFLRHGWAAAMMVALDRRMSGGHK